MMEKILIISGNIYRDSSANGICTRNLIEELLNRGDVVYCVSEPPAPGDTFSAPDNLKVICVKAPWYKRFLERNGSVALMKAVSFIRYFGTALTYPDVSPGRTRQVIRECEALLEEENISLVLGLYRPYESIAALLYLKKKYRDRIRCISYHLDLLLSPNNTGFIKRYKTAAGRKAFAEELGTLDEVLLPEGTDCIGEEPKVRRVGFPLYVKKEIVPCELGFSGDKINISYIGSLDRDNRNPEFFLKTVSRIPGLKDRLCIHFWGKAPDAVLEVISHFPGTAVYHGVTENRYVSYIYSESDFLLNISNKNTPDMIPSKIYQMFASEKPIINCVSDPCDRSKLIIDRYPAAFSVYEYRDNDLAELYDFLTSTHELRPADGDIFVSSTPEYIADLITGSHYSA